MATITIPSLEVRPAFLMQSEHYSTFCSVVDALYSITPQTSSDSNLSKWDYIDVGTRKENVVDCYAFIYSPLALGRTLNEKKMDDRLFIVHAIFDHMQSDTQSPLRWEHVDEFGWLTAFKELKWGVNVQEEFQKWEVLRDSVSTPSVRKTL